MSYTNLAISELSRLHAMAEHLLDLHRPRTHAVRACAPAAVAHEVAALLGIDTTDAAPTIAVQGGAEREVAIAPDALKQVLLNLCHNAREAMQGLGTIEIIITEQPSSVIIEVRDTGPGIPEAALPRVFDPFFTTKSAVHGVGLGLFVSEGIVRSHGGTIVAGNRDHGPGARFVMTLPCGESRVTTDGVYPGATPRPAGAT
jgi:signal transduction histidine kinase